MSAGAKPTSAIPRLIRDTLYAPECPSEKIAALIDVALTHHNAGRFEDALAQYVAAQRAWEDHLLDEAAAEAGLSALAAEVKAKPWILTGEPEPERAAPRRHVAPTTPGAAAEQAEGSASPSEDGSEDGDGGHAQRVDVAAQMEREQNIERLRGVLSMRPTVIPSEKRIFLRLAVGAVYSSAQQDGDALAEFGIARKILTSGEVPVYHATLLAASVYAALGAAHYHLSQFDYAGDYFFRCLEAREQLCGADHLDTAAAMNNVGAVLYVLGKSADSLVLFNRADKIVVDQLPLAHPRRDLVTTNIRIAKGTFFEDATFAPIPFQPYTVPLLPGAQKARQFRQPKVKKPAAKADGKGKGKK